MQNNNNKLKIFMSCSFVALVVAVSCNKLSAHPKSFINNYERITNITGHNNAAQNLTIPNLNKKVLELALKAYNHAKSLGYGRNNHLTIVDYSLASTERRMWVIDMDTETVVYNVYVAHGKGSGDNYANRFSNRYGSHMSSLGLFLTGHMYNGNFGSSLKLHGIDGKFNSNALGRGIVVHKAHYVDEQIISKIGRLGRSFGCLALNLKVADKIMQTIKGGSLVFCYYPDAAWINESAMLQS